MARFFVRANDERLDNGSPPVTGVPLSMSCWFNTVSLTTDQYLMTVSDLSATANSFALRLLTASDKVGAFEFGSGFGEAVTSTSYAANTWHHAAGVYTTDSSRAAFIDGGSKGTNATASSAPTGIDTLTIGKLQRGSGALDPMDGAIAEAAIWNVALTDAEIAILGLGYSPLFVRPSALVFYAPLVRGVAASGGDDIDIVGGLTLTDQNTVTVADHPRIIRPAPQLWSPFAAAAAPSGNPWYYYAQQQAVGAA